MEADLVFRALDADAGETSGTKAIRERPWVEGNEQVACVVLPGSLIVVGVGCDQGSAWPEHPEQLTEDLILNGGRRHMVQDGEAGRGRKPPAGESHAGRVPADHLDVGAGPAWAHLKRVITKVSHRGNPREQVAF